MLFSKQTRGRPGARGHRVADHWSIYYYLSSTACLFSSALLYYRKTPGSLTRDSILLIYILCVATGSHNAQALRWSILLRE